MSTQALTIRIGADASGAISVISQTTSAVNNLGQTATRSNSGVASLTGGVQNLGRYSSTSTSAMASLTGGVSGLSRATLDAVNGTTRLNQQLAENTRVANAAERSLLSFGNAARLAATSLAGFAFGKIISEIATFETKLNSLRALTMANTTQMKAMEMQARELGATTAFSAQQAAEAQGVLASTGLKVNEIMKATPQVLALAAAGNLELAKAAEISMATMKGLGLQVGDLGHINDVFAKVAADSAINVEQIGTAMGEAAPSMRAFGVSLETTSAAIGILKDNGMKVGSIGDGLKSMMGALANETKESTKILEKHNLTYKDLNVETLGIVKVLNNLKGANLSASESIKVLGLDAFNTATILQNNTKTLEQNSAALVKTSGDAQIQADILNQGLAKAWDAFKGSLSETALQMGETKASSDTLAGGLTKLVQEATGIVSIYEGMGEQFAKANKLTTEQYGHLKDVANQLNVIAGAAAGIGVFAGALWSANRAAIALNATLALISRHPIMAIAGIGASLYGANKSALSNAMADTDSQIAYYENRVNKYKDKSVLLRPFDFDLQKESTALTALKQAKQEKADFLKNQSEHSASIKGIIDETEKWYALADSVKETKKSVVDLGSSSEKSHKGLTDAQREAKKAAQDHQHLIEKFNGEDPYKKYAQSMAELNAVQKDLTPETFLLNQQKIAAEFEKSTVDLNAYNQEKQKLKSLLDAIATPAQKFVETIAPYTTMFNEGKLSLEQYSQALAHFQDQLNKPEQKLQEKYSEEARKSYENDIEHWQKLQRELTSTDDEMARFDLTNRKTSDGLQKLYSDSQINQIMKMREEVQGLKFVDDLGLSSKKIGESFATMFKDIALNGKSATQALGDMFKNMMNRITSTILDFIAQGFVQKMFSGFSSATGGLFSGLGGTVTALVGAVALGTYMGLQKHASGIAPTISQTSKYLNGVPADASLMLKTDAAVSDMVFLQTSKFADSYNKNLRDMLTSGFSLVRKNADSLGNFLNSTLNTYFPDFMQGLGELKTGISETFNGLVSGGKELIAKGTDAIGLTTDAVQKLAEDKLNAVFDKVSGVAGKSMEKLFGTVAVIVSVGTEVYSLVKSWDGLKGIGNKLLAVNDAIGGIATTIAITFSNPIAAAVAGVATAISQVGALIKDGFTPQNISRLVGGMAGAAIGTMILPGFGTLIGYVLGDTFGKLIGSLFQKQQKLYLGMDSLIAAKPYDNASLTSPKDITRDEGLAYTADTKGREIIFGTTMGSVLFGQTQGINQPLNQDQKDYAQSVAKTVNGIGILLNSLDQAIYGVTDKTNLLFRTNLHFEEKLDAKNFDSVKVMNSFFDDFLTRLSTTGTESAKKVTDWIRVFTDAFSKEYKMAVIVALTQSNEGKDPLLLALAKKPVEYMNYLETQVKKLVNIGKTQEQIFTDVTDTMLKAGSALDVTLTVLSDMGITAQDDYAYLVGMLNAMDSLGMSMYESASMVMALGKTVKDTFKNASNLTGDALKNALRDQMTLITTDWNNFVTSSKLTGSQSAQAFQSSLNLMQVSQDIGLADASKLSVFGSIINDAAKVAANKDNAYKPVDDANLALVKAQQSKTGITEAQTAYDDALKKYNKDFETYLLKSGAEIVNNLMFMQNIYLATNKKITDSMTASDFINATNSFVEALGGIDKAMQITDKNMQLALGEKGALKWKLDSATAAFVTALNKTGQTMDSIVNAYLNDPLNAELAKTVSLLGQQKDAQKAYNQSLMDTSKFFIDFSRSIKTWVDNVHATKLGTPTQQIEAAGQAFENQLTIAKGIGSSAEEKRAALSGITGYADTFIESIKSYYGSSEAGTKLIEQVVNDVSGLEKSIPIEQLQLGVLEDIKNGVYKLPEGLGSAFDGLIKQVSLDKANYDTNPNVINTLKLDTDSKLVLSVVSAKSAGANNEFIDAMLKSFADKNGIQAYLDFVINSTTFDTGEKLSKIDAAFKTISNNFSSITSNEIQSAYEKLQASLANNPTKLSIENQNALAEIKTTGDNLISLNGISTDRIINIDTVTALANVSNLTAGLIEMGNQAQIAFDKAGATWVSQSAANQSSYTLGNSFLESQATNLGYGGDLTDMSAMQNFLASNTTVSNSLGYTPNTDISALKLKTFALGGISNEPAIFGEAGAEAAVPLPDGRTIPVTLHREAANDNSETLAELKEQNKQLQEQNRNLSALIAVMQANLQESRKQTDSLDLVKTKIRMGER